MPFHEIVQHLVEWMTQLVQQYGYLGFFLISFIGAISIIIPIPYTVVIFALGGTGMFNPALVALAAGTGAAVGELSGYLLGFYGRKMVGEGRRKKMGFMVKVFDRFGPFAIFLFALTPLPDDLIFIPLGMMRYKILRAFIPALIGKMLMNFTLAYAGKFSVYIIRDIFGVGSDWMAITLTAILGVILLVIVIVIMLKIDWEKVFVKYVEKK